MYYTFNQNNSGGSWKGPQYVIVKADSASEANEIAKSYGVYFNGVKQEVDCECCGDRWCEVWEDEGTKEPTIFGNTDLADYDYELYK